MEGEGSEDVLGSVPDALDLCGKITIRDFKPIYTGPYSRVYRGEFKKEDQEKPVAVAVKVLQEIPGAMNNTMLRKLERERRIWATLRHPNILPLYGFVHNEDFYEPFGALISPWLDRRDAALFFQEHSMSTEERITLWKGILKGVEYLHMSKPLLIPGDLKPRNILIDNDGNPQICDFGLVRVFLEEGTSGMTTTSQHTGTVAYLAYELADGDDVRPTTASDIYAVGCLGLEFICSVMVRADKRAGPGYRMFPEIKARIPPAVRPPDLTHYLGNIWSLFEDCWKPNPADKPSVSTLLAQLEREMENEPLILLIPSLILLLRDKNPEVRSATASTFAELAVHRGLRATIGTAIPDLIELLKDRDCHVRSATAATLSKLAAHVELRDVITVLVPQFIKLLEDENVDVRFVTASTLVNLTAHVESREVTLAAIPQLIEMLEDKEWRVRSATASALVQLAPHGELRDVVLAALPSLIELFQDGSYFVRSAAASALAKLAEHRELRDATLATIPSLISLLHDPYYFVRSSTAFAFAEFAMGGEPRPCEDKRHLLF